MTTENQNMIWGIPRPLYKDRIPNKEINGTLVLDVDGTLTDPDNPYSIYPEAVDTLRSFLEKGGSLVFSTGASLGRVEETILRPMVISINPNSNFGCIVVLPEYGSAICLNRDLIFSPWIKKRELYTPNMDRLRVIIQEIILPRYPKIYIAGNSLEDSIRRTYTLGLKGLDYPSELKRFLETEVLSTHPEIDWNNIQLMIDLHSLDFVHKQAGKDFSLRRALDEIDDLSGRVIGFGDSGDEFAKVVPTFNVNPNGSLFKTKELPYLEAPTHLRGAGEAVVWIVKKLLDSGYFSF